MQYAIKTFEELTNTELYQMLKLRQEVFIIEQACIYPDIDNRDESAHHLIALDHGKIIGCLRILGKGAVFEEASIGRVVVSECCRGRGIAKKMMQQAIQFIGSAQKEKYIKISAQTYVVPFYSSLGFEAVSEEYLEDGIPHVDMLCGLQATPYDER